MDCWVVLRIADSSVVTGWRTEAERAMRDAGRPGMSDEEVANFVSAYLPAYDAYLPSLYGACAGPGVHGKPTYSVEVGGDRGPVSST